MEVLTSKDLPVLGWVLQDEISVLIPQNIKSLLGGLQASVQMVSTTHCSLKSASFKRPQLWEP